MYDGSDPANVKVVIRNIKTAIRTTDSLKNRSLIASTTMTLPDRVQDCTNQRNWDDDPKRRWKPRHMREDHLQKAQQLTKESRASAEHSENVGVWNVGCKYRRKPNEKPHPSTDGRPFVLRHGLYG
jgi:hypothetical protein